MTQPDTNNFRKEAAIGLVADQDNGAGWPEGHPAPDHSAELNELGEKLEAAMDRVDAAAAVLFRRGRP